MHRIVAACVGAAVGLATLGAEADTTKMDTYRVGVGRAVITPDEAMWMAGYASRKAPSAGKLHDLWAKALAIEDASGAVSVILTTDLLGLPARISRETAALVGERLGIPRNRLMLTASHTHSGPVVRDNLLNMYGLSPEEAAKVEAYTAQLPERLYAVIAEAVESLEPGTLSWGVGEAGFAKNRRKYTVNGVINDYNPIGPVDYDVPVLAALWPDGSVRAALFGYACHNTTLSGQQLSGDYAGFAQAHLEAERPGMTALFVSGCGGDQNPLPRGKVEQAEQYGTELGEAVLAVLGAEMAPVHGPLRAAYVEIPLELTAPPTREALEAQAAGDNVYIRRRAEALLAELDAQGFLDRFYPYPVQTWHFGDSLLVNALAGEVVVDYSLLLKHRYGRDKQFVIAYANDVFAYIPSLRVLREGGYEGESSMIYYGLHGPWAPSIEADIMDAVAALVKKRDLINLHDADAVAARRPLVIAHRGGVTGPNAPECSHAALLGAAALPYDMVELDVRETADQVPVVFHDDSLDQDCGVSGRVEDLTAAEVVRLTYKANGKPIMTLDEALALCRAANLGVMLDIKYAGSTPFFERIIEGIDRNGLRDATLCINGDPGIRAHLKDHIMMRVIDEELEAWREGRMPSLEGTFWFGQPKHLPMQWFDEMKEAGALIVPGVNVFRYPEASHMEDARRDIQTLLEAGADGFQIDSVYQGYFDKIVAFEAP